MLLSIFSTLLISVAGLPQNYSLPQGASVGIFAVTAAGDTLESFRKDVNFIPASNTKLVTAGTSLYVLGADFKFETSLCRTGEIRDSTLVGDLYIIGDGDPTTASEHFGITADSLFGQWAGLLKDKGISSVKGNVIGDGRAFPTPRHPEWEAGDLGFSYGAVPGALNFFGNVQKFTAEPGEAAGDEIIFTPTYPITPWMQYISRASTSPAGNGDELQYDCTDIVPVGIISGHLAAGLPARTEGFTNRFPELTTASLFREYLLRNGISVSGVAMDIDARGALRTLPGEKGTGQAAPKEEMTVLGNSHSPALREILREMMHRSDNFCAEAVFQAMGRAVTGSARADSCLKAELGVLQNLGLDTGLLRLHDGSGLSRTNYITPEWMVCYLLRMMSSEVFPTFLETLPRAGEGTLGSCLKKSAPEQRSRVRMKSGSMGGVRCYSGYIMPADCDPAKTIVFSIMINSSSIPSVKLIPFTDEIICGLLD